MKCKQCNKRFNKSWKLAQHVKFEHPKSKLIEPIEEVDKSPTVASNTLYDFEKRIAELNKDVRRCESVMDIIQNAIYLKNSGY